MNCKIIAKLLLPITVIAFAAFVSCSLDELTAKEFAVNDFVIYNLEHVWDGDPKAVDITPKEEGMAAAITIFYDYSRTPPSRAGRYRVTFNAGAAGYKTARGLSAGTLTITLVTDSTSILRTQLYSAYKNSIDLPIPVKLNIDLSLYGRCIDIGAESDRYLDIDLSDATGTSISGLSFSELDYGKIVSVILPAGLNTIGDFALAKFTGIKHLDLSSSNIRTIGDYAFSNCNLETIVLPPNLEEIGSFSFFNNQKLQSITIPDSVTSIGEWTFNSTGLKTLAIGIGAAYIGREAFYTTNLTSVSFAGNIAEFEGSVFSFPGDLQEKYLEGGIGTYTRPDVNSYAWSKK